MHGSHGCPCVAHVYTLGDDGVAEVWKFRRKAVFTDGRTAAWNGQCPAVCRRVPGDLTSGRHFLTAFSCQEPGATLPVPFAIPNVLRLRNGNPVHHPQAPSHPRGIYALQAMPGIRVCTARQERLGHHAGLPGRACCGTIPCEHGMVSQTHIPSGCRAMTCHPSGGADEKSSCHGHKPVIRR